MGLISVLRIRADIRRKYPKLDRIESCKENFQRNRTINDHIRVRQKKRRRHEMRAHGHKRARTKAYEANSFGRRQDSYKNS